MSAVVIQKSSGAEHRVSADAVVLDAPSVVVVNVARADIARFEQVGLDGVMTLKSGKVIRLIGFFKHADDGQYHDLVLQEENGSLYVYRPVDGALFTPIESVEGLLQVAPVETEAGLLTGGAYLAGAALGGVALSTVSLGGAGSFGQGNAGGDATAPGAPGVALETPVGENGLTTDPTVNVTDLEPGATWEYSTDGGQTWTPGTGDSFELPEGRYEDGDVIVRQTDEAGNVGEEGKLDLSTPIIVDSTRPDAPGVALETPVGENGLTTDPTVNVTDLEPGATWEYSTDGGETWTPGTGDSFELPEGLYEDGDVVVRQTDEAGNVGEEGKLDLSTPIIVDTGDPVALELTLEVPVNAAGYTQDTTVLVGDIERGATWEYSLDGGKTWQPGTGNSFELGNATYAEGQVVARQTDAAGRTGPNGQLNGNVIVDTVPPTAPTASLDPAVDLAKPQDSVTVNVTDVEAGATWQYSVDGGTSWSNGSGTGFELPAGTYDTGDILVRQTDAAGNLGPEGSLTLPAPLVVDQTAPGAPSLALEQAPTAGGFINDPTVKVTDLEPGAMWEYSTDGGKTWKPGTNDSFDLPDGSYSDGDVLVRQTDEAGNVGDPGKLDLSTPLTVDTDKPVAPDADLATAAGSSGLLSDPTVNVTKLEPGATWEYSTDGGKTWKDGTGSSFPLPEGRYEDGDVLVRQTDEAGNVGDPGKLDIASPFVVDSTDPTDLSLTLEVPVNAAGYTNDTTVLVGKIEPGGTWEYSLDGGKTWTPGTNGSFELAPGGTYAPGDVQARQTDAAGNVGPVTKLPGVSVDTTPPAAPTAQLADALDLAKPHTSAVVQVKGVEPDGTWQYSLDGGTQWIDGSGSFFTLPHGTYAPGSVVVRQTDIAGNVSPNGSLALGGALTVDKVAPPAPTVALEQTPNTEGYVKDATVKVSGLEAGATWQYSTDGGKTWTPGDSSNSFELADGPYASTDVLVRQQDAAGNRSGNGHLASGVTVDTLPPAAPTLSLDGAIDPAKPQDSVTVTVSNVEPGATWEYQIKGGAWQAGTGDSFDLPAGMYNTSDILVRQTDAAGNTGGNGTLTLTQPLDVDKTAPVAPTLALEVPANANGYTNDPTVKVSGLEAGATWEYSTDGGKTWKPGDSTNSFELDPNKAYQAGDIQARQTDAAGNPGPSGQLAGNFTVDTTPPAALTVALEKPVNSEGYTNNPTVKISGLEAGATWEYSIRGGEWLKGTGDSFTVADGDYAPADIRVRQTDAADNDGAVSQLTGNASVDTGLPLAPTAALAAGIDPSRPQNAATVEVSNLEPGATWEYSVNGGLSWAKGSGTSFELIDGRYEAGSIQVRQTDRAENTGPAGSVSLGGNVLVIETGAPDAPTLSLQTPVNDAGFVNDGTVVVGGLEAGATWEYRIKGGAWQPGTGNTFPLPEGSYASGEVEVRQTDAASNDSPIGQLNAAFTVDLSPPPAPTLTLDPAIDLAVDHDTATVKVDGLETGASWQYSVDGGTTWKPGTGDSFSLPEGEYETGDIKARQTDAAGNTGPANDLTLTAPLTIDQSAPDAPTATLVQTPNEAGYVKDATVNVGGLEPNATWEYQIKGGAWQPGSGTSFELPDGEYSDGDVLVRQTDEAGNVGPSGKLAGPVKVDATLPATPVLELDATVDPAAPQDSVTVRVPNIEAGATWEYSTDGGATWKNGDSSNSFDLPAGEYTTGKILARQTDAAGNVSLDGTLTLAQPLDVDKTPPAAPTVTLAETPNTNGYVKDGTVNVGGLEPNATWEYSTDGGKTWKPGDSTNSFDLPDGDYQDGDIRVRQTDEAGNLGDETALSGGVAVDSGVPAAPGLQLLNDTGENAGDGITNDGTISVTGLEPDATWEFSLNNGGSWQPGTGTSFVLPAGTHEAGQVIVRQTDKAGNTSLTGALNQTVQVLGINAVDDTVAHDMGLMSITAYPSQTQSDVQVLGLLEGQGSPSAQGADVTVPAHRNGRLHVEVSQTALAAVADAFRIEVLDANGNIVAAAANGSNAVVGDVLGLNVFELIGDDTLRVTFEGLEPGDYKIVVTNNQSALAALLDTDGGGISLEELGDNGVILGENNQQVVFDLLESLLGPLSTYVLEPLLTPLLNGLNGSPVGELVGGVTDLLDAIGLSSMLDQVLDTLAQNLLANTLTLLQSTTVTSQLIDYGFANETITGNVIAGQNGDGTDAIGTGVWLDHVVDADGNRFNMPETGVLTVEGKHGTLTIHENGSYSYAANGDPDSLGKQDVFTYGITDGSVTDSASLTINLTGTQIQAGDDVGAAGIHWVADTDTDFFTVTAGTVAAGFNVTQSTTLGQFTITDDQVLSGTVSILAVVDNGSTTGEVIIERQTATGWESVHTEAFALKSNASYQEVLKSVDVGALNLDGGTYRVRATLTGLAGSVATRADVDVTTPRPEVVNATGNLLDDDSLGSLDTALSLMIGGVATPVGAEGLSITTAHGVLTVQSNGEYVYAPTATTTPFATPVTETFTYQVTHPSGETATANLVVTLSPSGYGTGQTAPFSMMSLDFFEEDGMAAAFALDTDGDGPGADEGLGDDETGDLLWEEGDGLVDSFLDESDPEQGGQEDQNDGLGSSDDPASVTDPLFYFDPAATPLLDEAYQLVM